MIYGNKNLSWSKVKYITVWDSSQYWLSFEISSFSRFWHRATLNAFARTVIAWHHGFCKTNFYRVPKSGKAIAPSPRIEPNWAAPGKLFTFHFRQPINKMPGLRPLFSLFSPSCYEDWRATPPSKFSKGVSQGKRLKNLFPIQYHMLNLIATIGIRHKRYGWQRFCNEKVRQFTNCDASQLIAQAHGISCV